MKILASILSLYIFFLAVQPVLVVIQSSSKTECCSDCSPKNTSTPKQDNQNNERNSDKNCNPLMNCSQCIGITLSFQHFSLSPILPISEHNSFYKLNAVSEIALPIWQPPKIV